MTIKFKRVGGITPVYGSGPLIGIPITVGGPFGSVQFNDGGTFGGDSNFSFDKNTDSLTVVNISGSLTKLSDGTSYLVAGTNVTITSESNGAITISSTGGGGGGDSFFTSTTAGSIFTTGSAAFVGQESVDSPLDKGSDVSFYVSGSSKSMNGAVPGAALFGGDVRISGSLALGGLLSSAYPLSASGIWSLAQGRSATATGNYSFSHGTRTSTTGPNSHAEGSVSTASGDSSHAEGDTTIASGDGSHAEGYANTASGDFSHAEGFLTLASGDSSHAEGFQSIAVGDWSHVEGNNTIASGTYQHVQGSYNKRGNASSLFVIGNGTGDSNSLRSDVVRVSAGSIGNGRLEVTGSVAAEMGLSGSLTTLVDGTSYLVAGSNITIASASNGQVTISSTGGGTPAGSDKNIQYNNAGSFGASSNFNFYSSNVLALTGSFEMKGDIVPDSDMAHTLGTSEKRWSNVYTGDLHLRNDRGDWTIVEERDYLCVVNNITGKKYKMMLQPIDE